MTTQNPGLFIAFEGGDGAGKSTQAAELAAALESRGLTVLRTREPGGTPIGEKLRSLVLDHGHGHIDAHTEALIFAASRAAHASQVIRPALERGEIVLTDRYIDSSVAYQGAGRDLGTDAVRDSTTGPPPASSRTLPCCSTSTPRSAAAGAPRATPPRTGWNPRRTSSTPGSGPPSWTSPPPGPEQYLVLARPPAGRSAGRRILGPGRFAAVPRPGA